MSGAQLRRTARPGSASPKPQGALLAPRGARAGRTARQHTTRQLPDQLVLTRRQSTANARVDKGSIGFFARTKSRRASTATSTSRAAIPASSSTTSFSETPPSLSCRVCPQATSPLFAPRLRNATRSDSSGKRTRFTSLSSSTPHLRRSTLAQPRSRPPSHRQHASGGRCLQAFPSGGGEERPEFFSLTDLFWRGVKS